MNFKKRVHLVSFEFLKVNKLQGIELKKFFLSAHDLRLHSFRFQSRKLVVKLGISDYNLLLISEGLFTSKRTLVQQER